MGITKLPLAIDVGGWLHDRDPYIVSVPVDLHAKLCSPPPLPTTSKSSSAMPVVAAFLALFLPRSLNYADRPGGSLVRSLLSYPRRYVASLVGLEPGVTWLSSVRVVLLTVDSV